MIPGPRGYPIFGSMRLMRGLAHRHLDAVATRLGARRLMAFSLGGTRVIVTAHPNVDKHLHNRYAGERGREAADVDTMRVPTGLNLSPCQRLG